MAEQGVIDHCQNALEVPIDLVVHERATMNPYGSGTIGAPVRRRLLDRNRIGRRKGVLEGFVERLFLAPTFVAIVIVLGLRFGLAIISISPRALLDNDADPVAPDGSRTPSEYTSLRGSFSRNSIICMGCCLNDGHSNSYFIPILEILR